MTRHINRKTAKLPELALMLDTDRYGELTDDERERIYKAFMNVGSLLPTSGSVDVITSETVTSYVKFNILLWVGGNFTSYPFTEYGLLSALSSASSGDTICLPAGTITLSSTLVVPTGVEIVGDKNTMLTGNVTNNGSFSGCNISGLFTNNNYAHGVTCATFSPDYPTVNYSITVGDFRYIFHDGNFYISIESDGVDYEPMKFGVVGDVPAFEFSNESGQLLFGVYTGLISLAKDTVVNDAGADDVIFRVEGDAEANLIITDPANDRVGIATAAPSTTLHVTGDTTLDGDVTITDGENIVLDTTTGTEIGTAAAQKIGFFGTTPVVQQAHIVDADGSLADITTKFNTLLAQLEALGLFASS